MNEARVKVENFKKKGNFQDIMKIQLDVELPENFNSLDYFQQIKVSEEATDEAIARSLGVVLTDKENWPEEHARNNAKAWAETLPDK